MSKLKQWVALTLVGALAIAAGGWFLLVSPKRAEAADLTEQTSAQDSANASLQNQLAVLKAQSMELPAEQAKLAVVETKIPANPALPALIYSLTMASESAGVQFLSLSPGEPTAAQAEAAVPAAPVVNEDGTTTEAAAPVVNEDGTTTEPAPASTLQVIPVTISVNGGYFETERFLDALEDLPRALRVTVLAVTPGDDPLEPTSGDASGGELDGSKLTTSITAEIFMSGPITVAGTPDPALAAPGTAPAATPGPDGTPGPEVTTGPDGTTGPGLTPGPDGTEPGATPGPDASQIPAPTPTS